MPNVFRQGSLSKYLGRLGKSMPVSSTKGFTLIELIVTVAVTSIVLVVAVPSFSELIKNNRLTTATNDLVASLGLARSEAVKQELRVVVCKSADGASCVTTGNWEQGWMVFTDLDSNAAYDSGTESLLRVHGAIPGPVTMIGNTNVDDYISYVASGWSELTSGAFQAGTITVCDDRSDPVGKAIVLINTGRARVETGKSCP